MTHDIRNPILHLCSTGLALLIIASLFATSVMAADLGIPYEPVIEGVADSKLLAELQSISDTMALKDRPPAAVSLLRKRVERDQEKFLQLLKTQGYYGARVEVDVDSKVHPVPVTFHVSTGPAYLLKSVEFRISDGSKARPMSMPKANDIGLSMDGPFKATAFLDAQKELLKVLGRRGFPFSRVPERKVVVDHASRSVSTTLWVDPGPEARFGPVALSGLASTEETLVRRKIPWQEGDPYNVDLLEELQKRVSALGLFSTVRITPGESLDGKGGLPVTIAVTERKHRSIGAGVSYKSDEGPGTKFSWEHRNFFGGGERLGVAATVSDLTYAAEGGYRKPYFLRDDQSFNLLMRLAEDEPDAYTSRSLTNTALIERDVTKQIKLGGGVGFKASKVTQLGDDETYTFFMLPLQMVWDRSDDLLDPSRGGRLSVQMSPYYDVFEDHPGFVKGIVRYGHYLRITGNPSSVLAGRVSVGLIEGAERMEIPADERLYAGGGGSIRGYAFQSVGPRAGDVPLGGKSVLELSLEARVKVTDRFGVVGFVDGGNAFEDVTPNTDERLHWGTGLGIRYFTPVGPLRFDVGVPINRRRGIDDRFQFYVSLGQAF